MPRSESYRIKAARLMAERGISFSAACAALGRRGAARKAAARRRRAVSGAAVVAGLEKRGLA